MSARTQRTLYRLLAVFLAAGAGDGIIQFLSDGRYDWRHLGAVLTAAAVISGEQYLKNSGENAPPTVAAVNVALQNNATVVPPPAAAVPELVILTAPPTPPEPPTA
jgi:hypothetical protein